MPDGIPDYDELKVRIEPAGEGEYHVVAFAADGGTATGDFTSPISALELDNFILRVARPRARSYRSSQMEEAKQLGSSLFEQLMAEDVGDLYHGARRVAESQKRGLRISLSMTGAPELLEIPWELLYDPSEAFFLSQSIYTPVVRSLDLKSPRPTPSVTLPLQVLAMVSAPQGFPALDTGAERAKLQQALAPLVDSGAVKLDWLDTGTLTELDRRIANRDELHVIHYIGHGAYDERSQGGILVFEDERGGPHEVTGDELAGYMRDEKSLQLVVLNSCEGARGSHVDPFSGVASALLRCGIPAVVGMQAEITDEAAITFSDRLYTALAQGFPIDAAIGQSRRAIFAAGKDVEFGTPVLFMRVTDGRIFDITGPAPPPPLGRLEAELDPDPDRTTRGGAVTWRLRMRNGGGSSLSEVTARDKAGETRAGPLTLAPGATEECAWTQRVEHDVDECVTVGGRGSDGRLASVQASGRVAVEGGGRPSWLVPVGVGGLVGLVVAILLASGLLGGGGGDGGEPAFQAFEVGDEVFDLDARGDDVVFVAPASGEDSTIRRLDLSSEEAEPVAPPAPKFSGLDMGLDGAGHAQLVYSRCDDTDAACDIYRKPFSGAEQLIPVSTQACKELRPSMWTGLVLFDRTGGGCAHELMLAPLRGGPASRLTGATSGADLNDGMAVWLSAGGLTARGVSANGETVPGGTLEPADGDAIRAPLVVEGDYVYFVHQQLSQNFIARAKLPLDGPEIEHYVAREGDNGAEVAPHLAVTGDALYYTDYPQPDGKPGSDVIVRVPNPKFEPAD
jgi:hypothetical protein